MTARELRELLRDIPPDAELVGSEGKVMCLRMIHRGEKGKPYFYFSPVRDQDAPMVPVPGEEKQEEP